MIDLDCTMKSLRLAWLQRIYNVTEGPWKWYLSHLLTKFGSLFLFNCNYDVNDLSVPSLFYFQLLKWWSEFREDFALVKDWHIIVIFSIYIYFQCNIRYVILSDAYNKDIIIIFIIKNLSLLNLQTILIIAGPPLSQLRVQVSNTLTVNVILSLEGKYL